MTKQTMGSKISALRKEQGMTQAELAEIFGISVDELMAADDMADVAADDTFLGRADANRTDSRPAVTETEQPGDRMSAANRDPILDLILKVIPLAMGIAVTVLSAMKEIDLNSGFQLLGIGLTCVGIGSLLGKKH